MEHWARIARHWERLGPPLRPSAEDVAIVAGLVEEVRPARGLLLGATPELASLAWPRLVAVDHTRAMIGAILPPGANRAAIVGDWRALPFAARSIDLIAGDGALACLPFPDGYRALAAELARVARPGARVALRLFASPARREPLDDVRAGGRSFHALKWRIAMAIAPADRNVRVSDIWRAFEALVPDRAALPWPRATIDTIDAYRDSPAVYSFPTVDEVRAIFAGALVDVVQHTPRYELGDRCPTLVWRVR